MLVIGLIVLVGLAVCVFIFVVFVKAQPNDYGPAPGTASLRMEYQLGREPITRVELVNLCQIVGSEPECAKTTSTSSSDASGSASSSDVNNDERNRPRVLSAYLEADLSELHHAGAQFPADQIKVTAANVGNTGLLVSVIADPLGGHEVPSGHYSGSILVERALGTPIILPIQVDLTDRGSWVSVAVILVLLAGALVGALIKWMNDTFTPVAALRRRLVRLDRWFRWNRSSLPEGAQRQLQEIDSAVAAFDAVDVDPRIAQVSGDLKDLSAFADGIEGLQHEIGIQRHGLTAVSSPLSGEDALGVERDFIEYMQSLPWPCDSNEWNDRLERLKAAASNFRVLTTAIVRHARRPDDTRVRGTLDALLTAVAILDPKQLGEADAVVEPSDVEGIDSRSRVGEKPIDLPNPLRMTTRRPPRRPSEWVLDHAAMIMSMLGALLIAFVGYQTQFLNDKSFEGSIADYVQLAAWALALQISGTTVVQLVGRLTTSGGASAS
jgi:hypothetical protein